MLRKGSSSAKECLEAAADCELRAERATDKKARAGFVQMAHRWRRLADAFSFIERTNDRLSIRKR